MLLTQQHLQELLHYDPATGIFRWKVSKGNRKVGKIAGTKNKNGYCYIKVDGKSYFAHRLAFLLMTGAWPPDGVDHKDRNGLNNAWNNLRPANQSQNRGNSSISSNNTTRFKGVMRNGSKFQAQIMVNRKRIYLGTFNTPNQAHEAYLAAAVKQFGEFSRSS